MRLALIFLLAFASQSLGATLYVRSTDGSDADNGSTWALAKATLAGAYAAAAAGDTIYVSDNHAESQATNMTLTSPGTASSPVLVLCADDSAEPPTATATTGTLTTTGATFFSFGNSHTYYYGLTFNQGTGASGTNIFTVGNSGTSSHHTVFESCNIVLVHTGSGTSIAFGSASNSAQAGVAELRNTGISFGNASQSITVRSRLLWSNGSLSGTGPTTLFATATNPNGGARIVGVDLSAMGTGKTLVNIASSSNRFEFVDCKLGSSVAATTGTAANAGGTSVRLINCDSGDTNTRYEKHDYLGSVYSETTIKRTGGASDGTTGFSRRMASSANTKYFWPLASDPIYAWNETTGSTITVTAEVVTDNVTLTNAEAWIEVEYLGTSGFPLAGTASDRSSNILATGANQETSTETWTTTGLTTPVKQKLSVTFTPQEKGMIRAKVCLAKASTTMYVCPKVIDNADGKELFAYSPMQINQYAEAAPGGDAPTNFYQLLMSGVMPDDPLLSGASDRVAVRRQ